MCINYVTNTYYVSFFLILKPACRCGNQGTDDLPGVIRGTTSIS